MFAHLAGRPHAVCVMRLAVFTLTGPWDNPARSDVRILMEYLRISEWVLIQLSNPAGSRWLMFPVFYNGVWESDQSNDRRRVYNIYCLFWIWRNILMYISLSIFLLWFYTREHLNKHISRASKNEKKELMIYEVYKIHMCFHFQIKILCKLMIQSVLVKQLYVTDLMSCHLQTI